MWGFPVYCDAGDQGGFTIRPDKNIISLPRNGVCISPIFLRQHVLHERHPTKTEVYTGLTPCSVAFFFTRLDFLGRWENGREKIDGRKIGTVGRGGKEPKIGTGNGRDTVGKERKEDRKEKNLGGRAHWVCSKVGGRGGYREYTVTGATQNEARIWKITVLGMEKAHCW